MGLNFSGDFGAVDDKKIVIQSESNDRSTDEVIQWIKYLKPKILIEQIFDFYEINEVKIELSNTKFNLKLNDKCFNSTDSFWYRRGVFEYTKHQFFYIRKH
ncbi:hypothetical protein FIA58_010600 [Flavobacterium jejuense]|uniref:Uncharacterized protein n=1 Tax=Flavobacterium jejuense TaxID=1544455 RepID=A0ABX0IVL3_9FLAO|nr:hypothetical protein [Flavobacterium jejuense]NHN26126.1 hypothetical protein [Flavobacterium jejuense]